MDTTEENQPEGKAEERKTDINSLDLRFLMKELQALSGGFFKKIYQYGGKSKQFMFELYVPGKGDFRMYVDESRFFLSRKKEAAPKEPPSFCMFLRKHLLDRRIKEVEQYGFDRVLEIKTEDNVLILEFIRPGNVILCDSFYNIIMPLEIQQWKHRSIRPKTAYSYPPVTANPFEMDANELRQLAKKSDKKTVAFIASSLGFGGLYAKEVCCRAGLELQKPAAEMNITEIINLEKAIKEIDSMKPTGCLYKDAVTPFPLMVLGETYKIVGNFSDALDEYFSSLKLEVQEKAVERKVEEKIQKAETILEKHREAQEKWEKEASEAKGVADIIYRNYSTVETVINGIRKARQSGMSWGELKEKIKSEQTPETEAIKEIRENEGIAVLELDGKKVELDFRKSVEDNAASYFGDSKWAKKKIEGIEKSLEDKEKKLEEVKEEAKQPAAPKAAVEKVPARKKRAKWYEKYKWFTTSDGYLVVGGRNAEQNEEIVKKHSEDKDWLYHADIAGAAFVVIKTNGKPVTEVALKEAAEFAAANCKAWSKGLGTVDVFAFRPYQATKPEGSLPKGSFVITGERVWFRNLELKISVGVKVLREEERAVVFTGPVMAVRKWADYFVTIKPGFRPAIEVARKIKNSILIKSKPDDKFYIEQIPTEEFEKAIPSGTADIVEWGA